MSTDIKQEPAARIVTDDELTAEIRKIMGGADHEQLTIKMVRESLEKHFGTSLLERKSLIASVIDKILSEEVAEEHDSSADAEAEQNSEGDDDEDETNADYSEYIQDNGRPSRRAKAATVKKPRAKREPSEGKKRTGIHKLMQPSTPLCEFLGGVTQIPRTEVVKAIWKYVKEHDLQKPSDRRVIVLDDALKKVFKRQTFTMFSMNKYLGAHLKAIDDLADSKADTKKTKGKKKVENSTDEDREGSDDEEEEEEEEEGKKAKKRAEPKKRKRSPAPTKRTTKAAGKKAAGASDKKGGGLAKPVNLSPELADVVGTDKMGRAQVVKHIWQYIKEHELQDPSNRQNIVCDEKMAKLFGPKVHMLKMSKFLNKHMRSDDALAEDGAQPRPAKKTKTKAEGKVNGSVKAEPSDMELQQGDNDSKSEQESSDSD